MQQFAQFPFEVEPDDGDEEEEGMWEGGDAGAGGQLPRSMVYQRTSASWRPKHCSTTGGAYCERRWVGGILRRRRWRPLWR